MLRRLPPSVHAIAIKQRSHSYASRPEAGYSLVDTAADLAFMNILAALTAPVDSVRMRQMVEHSLVG